MGGAGDRDRTGMASLEGWGSTIELHPRNWREVIDPSSMKPDRWRSAGSQSGVEDSARPAPPRHPAITSARRAQIRCGSRRTAARLTHGHDHGPRSDPDCPRGWAAMPPPDLATAVGESLSFEFDGALV